MNTRLRARGRRSAAAIAVAVGLIALFPHSARSASLVVNGFVKDFLVVQDPPRVTVASGGPGFGDQLSASTSVADNLRIRINAAAHAAHWLSFDFSYNLVPRMQDDDAAVYNAALARSVASTYRIDDPRPSLYPTSPDTNDNFLVLQNLDRLSATIRTPVCDIFVGRQAIAWGSSKAVSPTDVLAPFLFTELDTEDRVGIDAVRMRVPVGALGEIDAGYVTGENGEWDRSAAFLRGKAYLYGTDVSLLAVAFRGNALFGIDATRAVGGTGVWCEAAVAGPAEEHSILLQGGTYARVTIGADYSFHDATYAFVEYHFSGAGVAEPSGYVRNAASAAYTEGAVYLLGRHYVAPGLIHPATPLVTAGGQLLINLDDGSLLAAPSVEYNAWENVYLAAGAFVGFGAEPRLSAVATAADVGGPFGFVGSGPIEFQSEFGGYPDTYFVSARYYF